MKHALKFVCLLSSIAAGTVGCNAPEPGDGTGAAAPPQGPPPPWILESRAQPRGVVGNQPGATVDFVLFSQLTSDTTYLIDRDGRAVHTWTHDKAGAALYLTDEGHIYRLARVTEPPNFKAGGVSGLVQQLDWDGELLWEWKMADERQISHHDIELLPNGNVLVIGWELITAEDARAAGRRADLVPDQGLWADWIVEVEPRRPDGARVVWEWHVWDHLVQSHDPAAPNHGDPAAHPRRLDVNADADKPEVDEEEVEQLKALGYVPDDATEEDIQSDFLHVNSVDYHPELDQIAISVPEIGELWILDHSTTTEEARGSSGGRSGHGGDILYRWGNPRAYGRGTKADQQLFYQHQVQWIPPGFDRAGNLTLFNNGGGRPDGEWSSVLEIEPPLEADGSYRLGDDPAEAFGPAAPVWSWQDHVVFSPFISGAHRLASGNTLVCAGPQGRLFEVTPAGEIVWDYRNPYHGDVPGWNPPGTEDFPYGVYRATNVPADHPGLQRRELRPLEPQPAVYEPPER
jgi:hypothetical protein